MGRALCDIRVLGAVLKARAQRGGTREAIFPEAGHPTESPAQAGGGTPAMQLKWGPGGFWAPNRKCSPHPGEPQRRPGESPGGMGFKQLERQ